MTKHTPGPWAYNFVNEEFDHDEWSIASGHGTTWKTLTARGEDCPIALVTGHWNTAAGEQRMEANASLIAAAPDMLATLEAIIAECESGARQGLRQSIAMKARAAIAQARGASPTDLHSLVGALLAGKGREP